MAEDYEISIDLDDVDTGNEPIESAKPVVQVHSCMRKMKPGGEYPYFEMILKGTEGRDANRTAWLNLSLHPKALWNLKAFLVGAGVAWPKGKLNVDGIEELLKQTVGRRIGVTNTLKASNKGSGQVSDISPPYTAVQN